MTGEIGGLDVETEALELDGGRLEQNFETSLFASHFDGYPSVIWTYKGFPRGTEDHG